LFPDWGPGKCLWVPELDGIQLARGCEGLNSVTQVMDAFCSCVPVHTSAALILFQKSKGFLMLYVD